jgi:primosomal protein N'
VTVKELRFPFPKPGSGRASCFLRDRKKRSFFSGDCGALLRKKHVTTEQAKLEEEQLLDLVRGGRDTYKPIGPAFGLDLSKLTEEQRKALEHILASRDLVMDVSGIAGAGKSHLLKQVAAAASCRGKSVAILSPTDASVKDLRKTGFQARTFQGFQTRTGTRGGACD